MFVVCVCVCVGAGQRGVLYIWMQSWRFLNVNSECSGGTNVHVYTCVCIRWQCCEQKLPIVSLEYPVLASRLSLSPDSTLGLHFSQHQHLAPGPSYDLSSCSSFVLLSLSPSPPTKRNLNHTKKTTASEAGCFVSGKKIYNKRRDRRRVEKGDA